VRLVFLGTPAAAVPSLRALHAAGHDVAQVITQPDRPAGRSAVPRPTPVKEAALELGLPVAQPRKVRDAAFLDLVRGPRPDAVVVVAYGRILPLPVLEAAPMGAINVHFSLLPRYRGAAPVQWALVNREPVTGVTTMQISEGLDEGPVLLQSAVAVEPGEHAPALTGRLSVLGAGLLLRTLEGLRAGTLRPIAQDPAEASLAPLLRVSDGWADFRRTARDLEGRVRGLDPWPGLWAWCQGRRLRLVDAEALPGEETPHGTPPDEGTVLGLFDGAVVVSCGFGSRLAIRQLQAEGRRPVSAREAWNGRQVGAGVRLEGPPIATA
jgi:methionyl-tRNA formyltransferase